MKTNLLDNQAAKAAAKRIFQKVNFSGGPLQSYEISGLLTDTYEYLKIPFKPTTRDIKTYSEVLDVNKDGQVTLADLQNLAVQYLCGPGVLTNQPFDPNSKKQKFQISGLSTNSYSSSFTGNNNSYQTYQNNQNYQSSYNTYEKPSNSSKNIGNGSGVRPPVTGLTQVLDEAGKTYSEQTLNCLSVTRKIFQNYADQSFTITASQVPQVLAQTYEMLGRKGYRPNQQDVKVWMKLCDGNGDGHVQYQQYEYFVVRSLQRSGFAVYK